ncbi:MAG: aminotransferase class I/II-fold pyridoxal phosphate-dependent enzyme [Candidatus Melainabacteria bacterium]|nr:aminotransferase class I/II-fold pyridoxal phosphate-dependent enzyme [Candidatus Melainabacteria bacterium]
MMNSAPLRLGARTHRFTESVIREMTRLANRYDAINLAQGFPDFSCPEPLKLAACEAIMANHNQYAPTWGDVGFRQAIAEKCQWYLGLSIDPDRNITVTCGSTEAMAATLQAVLDPGDEVILFEPFYENYGPDVILAGAVPRYVRMHPPHWSLDEAELRAAFNDKTRAIIINSPNNPTGKVYTAEELGLIAELCQQWNVLAITDEIYEHITYDGREHLSLATLPGMAARTVVINGLSKTYSVTGWRIGYVIAPADITALIRKVHDYLAIAAPTPFQKAGVAAMQLPRSYYFELGQLYREKRKRFLEILEASGVRTLPPQGAYYVFADIGDFGYHTDVEFSNYLVKEVGVAAVPGSSFFRRAEEGHRFVRFCFSKTEATLEAAAERLGKLRQTLRLAT